MNQPNLQEIYWVGEQFKHIVYKYAKLESKKRLYKDFKDLSLIEIRTLSVIGQKDQQSMSEIAAIMDVSAGPLTITIERLHAKGYVERIRDEKDRRQVFITLTEKGMLVYLYVQKLKEKVISRIFGILDDEERKMLLKVMQKLNEELDELILDNEEERR